MAINAIIGFKMRQQQETTRSRPAANKRPIAAIGLKISALITL